MEIRMYEHSWHGIEFSTLDAASRLGDSPAGPEFYAEFYAALAAGKGRIDPVWEKGKIALGKQLGDIFSEWKSQRTILAIAAGKAVVEREWLDAGFDVTFNDCQASSLADLCARNPEVKTLIGDARTLNPERRFSIITLITLDYALTRKEMIDLMVALKAWLEPQGRLVVYCTSTLNWRQIAAEFVKRLTGRYRNKKHILWGWMRSPGEFLSIGKAAGYKGQVYDHSDKIRIRPWWRKSWMRLNNAHCTVVFTINE
jgi:hypothetical protein